jgi:hypothetical protein
MLYEAGKFKILFRKYRLKSEISTLSEMGNALAEKGFIYEDSIFSHWQKGSRIPQNRVVLLRLIEIFAEKGAITTFDQANEFLSSAAQGYLTEQEIKKLNLNNLSQTPFQIPTQISNFTGREKLISKIRRQSIQGKVILLYGQPGVGKTALAIQLGHTLKNIFKDGIFWFRLDTTDVMDILLSIAFAFGLDIGHIQNKEIRASFVRSLIAKKNILLILDNAEANTDISLLQPNTGLSSVFVTSRTSTISISGNYETTLVETFNHAETFLLFRKILGDNYCSKHKSEIARLASLVGNLPLALNIFAREIEKDVLSISELIKKIEEDLVSLEDLSYEDKNLFAAIDVSFKLLDSGVKKIFTSLAVFNGKDFSTEAVAFINDIEVTKASEILNNLKTNSLIESSRKKRYRIHTIIKKFIRTKLDNTTLFLNAAKYYEKFLSNFDNTTLKSYPNIKQESDNVLYIFKKCYELNYWNEVIALWNPLEKMLYATNQLNKMRYIYQIGKTQKSGINLFQKALIIVFCILIVYWILLNYSGFGTPFWYDFYSFSFGLISFTGGILGFFISKSWGLFKSSIGRAVFFLSLGLFSWGMGSNIWSYYNFFLNNPAPYPSLADLGYMPAYGFWTIGMIYLPHAIGGKFGFLRRYGKLAALFIPILVLSFSYFLLVFISKSNILFTPITSLTKLFFDIAYPASDAIILTTALILGTSFQFFGGKYKLAIYSLLLGFCFQYIADFLFTYAIAAGIYHNGYFGDLIFTIGLSLITFGVFSFYLQPEKGHSAK